MLSFLVIKTFSSVNHPVTDPLIYIFLVHLTTGFDWLLIRFVRLFVKKFLGLRLRNRMHLLFRRQVRMLMYLLLKPVNKFGTLCGVGYILIKLLEKPFFGKRSQVTLSLSLTGMQKG